MVVDVRRHVAGRVPPGDSPPRCFQDSKLLMSRRYLQLVRATAAGSAPSWRFAAARTRPCGQWNGLTNDLPSPPLPCPSNIPALPPIIQDLPSNSEAPCPPPAGSEPPPHRETFPPAVRSSPSASRPLEGRVAAVEQANCSLLEEVVRLHGKLRAGQRGGVEERREELGSVGGQVQEELRELSSLVQRAGLDRQSVEETARQLHLSVEVTVAFTGHCR